MVLSWVFIVISGIATAVKWLVGAAAEVSQQALELTRWLFERAFELYKHAYDLAPRIMKFLTLLFFITIIGGLITFFLQFYFVCDSGDVRQANTIISGFTVYVTQIGYSISGANITNETRQELFDDNTFLVDNSDKDTVDNIMKVTCDKDNDAILTVFGINMFDPVLYIMGAILWILISFLLYIRSL